MNGVAGAATGAGLAGALLAGLWLWQGNGLAVWLETGLSFCF